MSGIILGFDFGIKNIGVAIGQRITNTAKSLNPLKVQNGIPNWISIKYLLNEWQPDEVIVGLPLNMDGSEQFITACARKFADKINNRFNVIVKLHDERLSTVEARTMLFELYGFRALSENRIHSVAAVVILESYLERCL